MLFQALFQTFPRHAAEFARQGHALGKFVHGEVIGRRMQLYFKMTALVGYLERVFHGLAGNPLKTGAHFLFRFVVEVARLEAEALGVVHLGLRLNAEQNVVGLHVVGIQVVAVVGGHKGQARGVGKLHDAFVHLRLFRQAVGLHFQIEAVGEERGIFLRYLHRVLKGAAAGDELVGAQKRARNFARHAGGKGHETVGAALQHVLVDARLVVEAVEPAAAHKMHEILVARGVLCQQNEVMAHPGEVGRLVGMVAGDIDLAAYDGGDAHVLAGRIEIGRAEQVAVIGDGRGGHAEGLGLLGQIAHADGSVQQAELRMTVKMHKIRHDFSGRVLDRPR